MLTQVLRFGCAFAQDDRVLVLDGLRSELFAEAFHLGEGVLVARAVGSGDAVVKAGEGLFGAAQLGKGLGRHLEGGDVVGIVADEGGELGQPLLGIVLADVLHGKAVAGKRVGGVKLEEFGEGGNLVHGLILAAVEDGEAKPSL